MAKNPAASGHHFPPVDAKKAYSKQISFSTWKGAPRTSAWPRKRGQPKSATTLQQNEEFARFVAAVADMPADQRIAAMEIASGSQYTWRDVLSRAITGQLVYLDGGTLVDIQMALDTISEVTGAIIIRTADGWVALLPGAEGEIMTITSGLPAWRDGSADFINELTGAVIAGPGGGSQVATLSNTGATPGSFTNTNLTIGPDGRITAIANGSGGGGGVGGLWSGVMSAVPTAALTGFTTWLNQGSASVADSAAGIAITAPSAGANVRGRVQAAPVSLPYTITALVCLNGKPVGNTTVGLGWYDGSNKLHFISLNNNPTPVVVVTKWNSPTSFNGNDYVGTGSAPPMMWFRLNCTSTNVTFSQSNDGVNFTPIFSVAKASGFLGATGYSNIFFGVVPNGEAVVGTLMSYA